MQSRIFCSQKKKQAVSLVDLGKSDVLFLAKLSLFFPLFWLYFIRRIYENGDKVKLLPNRLPPKKVVAVLLPKSAAVEKVDTGR